MDFEVHSHRYGEDLLKNGYPNQWAELQQALLGISDDDLIKEFPNANNSMSLSAAINNLIDRKLVEQGWARQAFIFQDPEYATTRETIWRLDFAKKDISIEVSFNHGEALAWNLTKPVLASELNHVRKAIQTKIGVIILATQGLKEAGAFDGAVGTFEKAIRYLRPMNSLLTVPLLLIGLKAPKTFVVDKEKRENRNHGIIRKLPTAM